VELSDCAGLISLDVFYVETAHQEIITPDMLRDKVYLQEHKENVILH